MLGSVDSLCYPQVFPMLTSLLPVERRSNPTSPRRRPIHQNCSSPPPPTCSHCISALGTWGTKRCVSIILFLTILLLQHAIYRIVPKFQGASFSTFFVDWTLTAKFMLVEYFRVRAYMHKWRNLRYCYTDSLLAMKGGFPRTCRSKTW